MLTQLTTPHRTPQMKGKMLIHPTDASTEQVYVKNKRNYGNLTLK